MLKEFRDFINRGNMVDLAVAVVLGGAFALVVNSFSTDILGGVLALIGGQPNLDSLSVTISDTTIFYGRFLTAVINFLIVAVALFLVVKAINRLPGFRRAEEVQAEATVTEVELLSEIRDLLQARG